MLSVSGSATTGANGSVLRAISSLASAGGMTTGALASGNGGAVFDLATVIESGSLDFTVSGFVSTIGSFCVAIATGVCFSVSFSGWGGVGVAVVTGEEATSSFRVSGPKRM